MGKNYNRVKHKVARNKDVSLSRSLAEPHRCPSSIIASTSTITFYVSYHHLPLRLPILRPLPPSFSTPATLSPISSPIARPTLSNFFRSVSTLTSATPPFLLQSPLFLSSLLSGFSPSALLLSPNFRNT